MWPAGILSPILTPICNIDFPLIVASIPFLGFDAKYLKKNNHLLYIVLIYFGDKTIKEVHIFQRRFVLYQPTNVCISKASIALADREENNPALHSTFCIN